MIASITDILDILCCPRCRTVLVKDSEYTNNRGDIKHAGMACPNPECRLLVFTVSGQPVLIDFDTSIIDRDSFQIRGGASTKEGRDDAANSIKTRLFSLLFGGNPAVERLRPRFITDLKKTSTKPRLLVVGGGAIGTGTAALYTDPKIELIGFDVYVSPNTTFVADAHRLPLIDESVDAVWIQAVLEHVLDPNQVVSEIYRVLKPNGLVFSDSPFMQQVHEGAYDFTRFTLSGHRWLFRHFSLIEAGTSGGPGSAALWNIRYFVRAVFRNDKIGTAVQMACFWLRYLDKLSLGRRGADAASGVYFYGRKAEAPIKPRDIVAFYESQEQLRKLWTRTVIVTSYSSGPSLRVISINTLGIKVENNVK